jgi:hypothetical protein
VTDDAQARLNWREKSTLRQMEEELSRADPQLAAALSGLPVAVTPWPRIFRMPVRVYLILGALLLLTAMLIHQTLCFLVAVSCLVYAAMRAHHRSSQTGSTSSVPADDR